MRDFEKVVIPSYQYCLETISTLPGHLKMTIVQILNKITGNLLNVILKSSYELFFL
jgi:hypothetical protein